MPVIATVIAAVWVVAGNAPAFADQVRAQEWWLGALDVGPAWQASRGGGVTVAVLSDGVDATHADVAGVTVGPDLTNSGEITSTFTGLQGTAIASLIAGHGHGPGGSSGIIGVAPRAKVLSIRVTLDPNDPAMDRATVGAGLPDAIANGIRYAVAHHAKVIDLPVDPGQPSPAQVAALPIPPRQTTAPELTGIAAAAGGSSAERAAIAYAEHKGVVLVAPAGDNGAGNNAANFPAAYRGVLVVGAFGPNLAPAGYSSRQRYVALTASGSNVTAASPGGGYTVLNSTTAASAMVAGIAALIRSRFPGLSAATVVNALTSSAVFRPAGLAGPGSASAGTAGAGAGSAGSAKGAANAGLGNGTADAARALVAAAALAAPASARAGAGAVGWAAPAAPSAAPAGSNGLAPKVLRAAIISVAALILLLLLVVAYAATRRRKDRQEAKVSADWVRSTQNAYSPYGSEQADQMLEYFAAPTSPPSPADPFAPFSEATAGTAGSAGAQFGGSQLPGSQITVGAGAGSDIGAGTGTLAAAGSGSTAGAGHAIGAWVPLGTASRVQSRPPRVSGAPPWEPAAEPDTELPWAAVPGTPAGAARIRPAPSAASPASDSIWPTSVPAAAGPSSSAGSPSGQAWDDLVASAAPAAAASSSAAPASAWPGASEPGPAGRADASAARAASAAGGAAPAAFRAGGASTSGPADSPGLAGSLWQARATPPSPSGSDWETSDEPERQIASGEDPDWPQADSDAFRQPAAAEPSWPPAGGRSGWQPAADQASAAPGGEAWAAGQARAAGLVWGPAESTGRDSRSAEDAASQEQAEPADDTAWDAQGSGGSPHWLAAAVSERWQAASRSGQRQPTDAADTASTADAAPGADPLRTASADAPGGDPLWSAPTDARASADPLWSKPAGARAAADSSWSSSSARSGASDPLWSASGNGPASDPLWSSPGAESAAQSRRPESSPRESASAQARWGSPGTDAGW